MNEIQTNKGTILVVDDTPSIIDMVLSALEDDGWLVMAAMDGKQAIERVEQLKPDLILMDILMPGMDGYETCRQFKQAKKTADIPIIFMSALHDTPDKVKGFQIGAVDYITKPIEIEELMVRVNTHLTIGRLQTRLKDMNESLEEKVDQRTRELQKANRMLKMLSASNQSLVRCENETSLLNEVCRVIVEIGGHSSVWIGFAGRDAAKRVRPAAQRGFDEGLLEKIHMTRADDDHGEAPGGAAIRTGKYRIVKDMMSAASPAPWREAAAEHGYRSCIALPLHTKGDTLGSLNIYAKEPDAFREDEIHLLMELADDLAFGVASLRIRSERDRSLEEMQLSKTLLEISSRHRRLPPLLDEYVHELQHSAGLGSVGVRLLDEDGAADCQAHAGIGKEFHDTGNLPLVDGGQGVYIDVIQGKTDPGQSFFTDWGSFYLNGVTAFLAGLTEGEKRNFGDAVSAHGCESVALVPIKAENRILGVIHLADPLENKAPLNKVNFIERLAAELGPNVQRVWAEARLQASEERFRTIFQHGAIGMRLADIDGRSLMVNGAMCKILGYSEEELLNETFVNFTHPEDRDMTEKNRMRLLEGAIDTMHFEKRYIHKSGRVIHAMVGVHLLHAEDHSPLHFITHVQDVTHIKGLETQLRQARKMEGLGTFAGGIAHDFNNILTVIIGYAELSKRYVPESTRAFKALECVVDASLRARDLVGQMLTFSRKTEHEKKPIKIESHIKEIIKFLRASLPSSIEIRKTLASKTEYIIADPTQIHQVLMNLCSNAGHSMKDAGGLLEILSEDIRIDDDDLDAHPESSAGPWFKLVVRDTGHGMDEKTMDRIFDPYFTTKDQGEGTGLGLSVVHGIIKSHGGSILAESELGKGTTFTILLPAPEIKVDASRADAEEPLPTGNETILFVDDEEQITHVGKDMLERLGYKVIALTSPADALDAFNLASESYDLVITDKTMPKMDGFELAREIRKIRPDIPIVVDSGYKENVDNEKSKVLGIDAFILKPFDIYDMARTMRKVLDR